MMIDVDVFGGGATPLDLTNYKIPSNVTSVTSGNTMTLTGLTQKPRYVLVTYSLTSSDSPYFRNDFCDLENNVVFTENKPTGATTLSSGSYALTDEVSYSGTTLTIKNKTSGTRYMSAVAFY